MTRVPFTKGHGTGNDFLLLLDPNDEIQLSNQQVTQLCDRHFGVGADGILRAVKSSIWFMDYRNADGSIAEMCGNGIRVFAEFLFQQNLINEVAEIKTRAGIKRVERVRDRYWSVDMGSADLGQSSVPVHFRGFTHLASPVNVGNPHLVVQVDTLQSLPQTLEWSDVEKVSTHPDGFNLEFIEVTSKDTIAMRVLERGVGETLSCGTGVCAAAMVHMVASGTETCSVNVPGGTLLVDKIPGGLRLSGPAELIADGNVELP